MSASEPLPLPQPLQSRSLEVQVRPPQCGKLSSTRVSVWTRVERLNPTPSTSISANAAEGVFPAASKRINRTMSKSTSSLSLRYSPVTGSSPVVFKSNSTTLLVLLFMGRPSRLYTMRFAVPPKTGIPGLTYTEKKLKGRPSSLSGKITRNFSATTARPRSISIHHFSTGSSPLGCHHVVRSWSPAKAAVVALDGVRAKRCAPLVVHASRYRTQMQKVRSSVTQ